MIKRFLKYTEITTKITSVFAFLMTLAYIFYTGNKIDLAKTAVFFAAMLLFDLTTTAINNYVDTKSNDQQLQFERLTALIIIIVLFLISAVLGIYLAVITDIAVLFLGGVCFLFGVAYSYGPLPISRQPSGEFFSGLFYGFFIPLILLYINMPKGTYFSYELSLKTVNLSVEVLPVLTVILLSAAPFCTTANIMLANNICDVEKDVRVKRYTLPFYIGTKRALYIFAGLYYIIYPAVTLMVIFKMLPPVCLLLILTAVPVTKNINKFFKKQEKQTTFILSVKNYVIIMAAFCILIFIGGFIH